MTNQNIKKHAELFIDYGPKYLNLLEKPKNPQKAWYYELWKKFKQHHSDQWKYIFLMEQQNRNVIRQAYLSDV